MGGGRVIHTLPWSGLGGDDAKFVASFMQDLRGEKRCWR